VSLSLSPPPPQEYIETAWTQSRCRVDGIMAWERPPQLPNTSEARVLLPSRTSEATPVKWEAAMDDGARGIITAETFVNC
jgi:hypothetical protein